MKRWRKITALILSLLALSCLLFIAITAVSNQNLPQRSQVVERLDDEQKSLLAEARHLRQSLGDAVWPGWGQADIPSIAYNEQYAFLTGYPQPPDGWKKVPGDVQHGGPWEEVPGDRFDGDAYYRQYLPDPNLTPQGFAVKVGERWASSMQTMQWMKVSLVSTIRTDLPSFLRPVFPYQVFVGQLLGGSDHYITLLNHEVFHAYQGMAAPDKLAQAESANGLYADQYPWQDPELQADWKEELVLLAEALESGDQVESISAAREFLELRLTRREKAGLSPALIRLEQQREWVEGLARYAELEIWRQAYSGAYAPTPELEAMAEFDGYQGFNRRWSREIDQFALMADDEGDGRFYYSGMAQAYLLDRIMPGWKLRAFEEDIWLEDLLHEGVQWQ